MSTPWGGSFDLITTRDQRCHDVTILLDKEGRFIAALDSDGRRSLDTRCVTVKNDDSRMRWNATFRDAPQAPFVSETRQERSSPFGVPLLGPPGARTLTSSSSGSDDWGFRILSKNSVQVPDISPSMYNAMDTEADSAEDLNDSYEEDSGDDQSIGEEDMMEEEEEEEEGNEEDEDEESNMIRDMEYDTAMAEAEAGMSTSSGAGIKMMMHRSPFSAQPLPPPVMSQRHRQRRGRPFMPRKATNKFGNNMPWRYSGGWKGRWSGRRRPLRFHPRIPPRFLIPGVVLPWQLWFPYRRFVVLTRQERNGLPELPAISMFDDTGKVTADLEKLRAEHRDLRSARGVEIIPSFAESGAGKFIWISKNDMKQYQSSTSSLADEYPVAYSFKSYDDLAKGR